MADSSARAARTALDVTKMLETARTAYLTAMKSWQELNGLLDPADPMLAELNEARHRTHDTYLQALEAWVVVHVPAPAVIPDA